MMFLGVLIAMLLEATLEGFIVALAGGGVLGAAISSRMLLKELKIRPVVKLEVREWRLILRNSLPMGFSSVLGQFWVRMGALLLGIYWSSRIVGEYGAAFRVFETTYFLPGAIMGVGMYYLSSAFHQDSQKFDIELRRVFKMILFCALILSGSVFMASPWIIGTLFGQEYTESVPVLKLFAVAINFVFLNYLGSHLMVILGLQRRHVLNVLIAFALAMVLLLQLANSHAALGAATAFLVTEAGLLLLTIIALWKKIRLQSRPFFKAEDKDILAFGER
jgi:O-antigen/teichoic acid export membrane protein